MMNRLGAAEIPTHSATRATVGCLDRDAGGRSSAQHRQMCKGIDVDGEDWGINEQ